jgi:hypothetical protein
MRTREVLVEGFEEVKILLQYLYMNEDNNIDISNGITKLRIKLAESLEVLQMNLSFPHLGYTCRDMRIEEWLACVEQLKEQPSDCGYGNFSNKWEEIKTITLMQIAWNKEV